MTASIDPRDTDRFRAGIARRLGLAFDETKWSFLAEILQRRIDHTGIASSVYLDRLESRADLREELRALARDLTVGETYFFRNIDQFHAVAEVALPNRIAARSSTRALTFLSAGCASGEEPYSLAMLTRERMPDPRWRVSILGIDVNPAALARAAHGRFSPWALRETPEEAQRRWFRGEGREQVLDPTIQKAVTFEERNLVEDDPAFWRPEIYDVVFCRNVMMYFTPEVAAAVMARITRCLAPGGYLFLGHAETLRGLSHDFHLRHTHGTFYYQRKDTLAASEPAQWVGPEAVWRLEAGVAPLDPDGGATWIETIQRASERIRALTEARLAPGSAAVDDRGTGRARPDLSFAIDLLKKERFFDALALLGELPSETANDLDALLLRAALLTHSGQLDAAQAVCGELLALDDLNAGAHYLLALCREGTGDRTGAVEHDQVAAYLDPAFAMPRLHMGLLARRAGQRESARRELGLALPLLQREDASRLLLFGGGFNRETLAALCRVELTALGGET